MKRRNFLTAFLALLAVDPRQVLAAIAQESKPLSELASKKVNTIIHGSSNTFTVIIWSEKEQRFVELSQTRDNEEFFDFVDGQLVPPDYILETYGVNLVTPANILTKKVGHRT